MKVTDPYKEMWLQLEKYIKEKQQQETDGIFQFDVNDIRYEMNKIERDMLRKYIDCMGSKK